MENLFVMFGWEAFKPVVAALLLPPIPLLLLILLGTRLVLRRRLIGWTLVALGVLLIGALSARGTAILLRDQGLAPPPALSENAAAALRRDVQAGRPTAILVLGGGRRAFAPELGTADLEPATLERLRYGVWLARQTGASLAFTGGLGWESGGRTTGTSTEAEVAARVARTEFGLPLRWQEADSRDTRENAILSLRQLHGAGVTRVVIVTHTWHMPRALRVFEAQARSAHDGRMQVVAAPMGFLTLTHRFVPDWMPSGEGMQENRRVLREMLARLAGG
jgi:uncharacterized SAM-binding protein YcdF (DUF218 family)